MSNWILKSFKAISLKVLWEKISLIVFSWERKSKKIRSPLLNYRMFNSLLYPMRLIVCPIFCPLLIYTHSIFYPYFTPVWNVIHVRKNHTPNLVEAKQTNVKYVCNQQGIYQLSESQTHSTPTMHSSLRVHKICF